MGRARGIRTRIVDEKAIEGLAEALGREGRAPGTVECYLRAARAFSRWLGGRPVAEGSAAAWRDELLAGGYSPSSVNVMVAGVNRLLRAMGREGWRARALRVQRRPFRDASRELTRSEYHRLLAAARARGRRRAALAMEAICATGIRVGELRFLTVEAARRGRAEVSLKGKVRTVLIPRRLVCLITSKLWV